MSIRNVIFDLGGVLVLTHWDRVTGPLSELSGLSPEAVMDAIATGDAYYPFMRGEFGCDEFHSRLSRQLGITLEARACFDIWSSIIAPNDGVGHIVEALKDKYRLALGSNTDMLHYARGLEVQPVLAHIDEAILSYEVGCCKPDLDFFRRGLDRLEARPEECVFIDDRQENVEAAEAVGITGIQFQSVARLESDLAALGLLRAVEG